MKSKNFLVPSNPCLSLSSPSLERLKDIELYIIFPFHARHKVVYHLLITILTLISSHAPGEPLQHYARSYGIFQRAPRHSYMMSLRCTKPSLSSQPNGLALLSSYESPISLQSTLMTTLGSPQQEVSTDWLQMQGQIISELQVLARFPSGSMTIYFSESCADTSQPTTKCIKNGTGTLLLMVVDYKMAVDTGFKGKPCQMGMSWSLMKMQAHPSKISRWHHLTLSMIHASPIMTLTSIACQMCLAFHGKFKNNPLLPCGPIPGFHVGYPNMDHRNPIGKEKEIH
jgi:hypothetical protein